MAHSRKKGVTALFLKSGSALLLHDVSKKDLNLGFPIKRLRFIINGIEQRRLANERSRVWADTATRLSKFAIADAI
jgi:hypothetical protein